MYRRISLEDLPKQNTMIWACTAKGCKVWMRDNFAFEYKPICRLCLSPMVCSMKELPILVNTNRDLKSMKKGVQIKLA